MQRRALKEHLRYAPSYVIAAVVGLTAAQWLSLLSNRMRAVEVNSQVHRLPPLTVTFENLETPVFPKRTGFPTFRYVSPDGDTVAGEFSTEALSSSAANDFRWNHAFVWTKKNGLTDVGAKTLGANGNTQIQSVSANGAWAIIADDSPLGSDHTWVVWSRFNGSLKVLTTAANPWPGQVPGFVGTLSADGGNVMGKMGRADQSVYHWNSKEGMKPLPDSVDLMTINAVAPRCSAVVGRDSSLHPSCWTEKWGQQDLGLLPGSAGGEAYAVSDDGRVIAGRSGNHLFRWMRERNHLEDLGCLPEKEKAAPDETTEWETNWDQSGYQVSANGAVILGRSSKCQFLWTTDSGIIALSDLLRKAGGKPDLLRLSVAGAGLSADGRTVTGISSNSKGNLHRWRLHLTAQTAH